MICSLTQTRRTRDRSVDVTETRTHFLSCFIYILRIHILLFYIYSAFCSSVSARSIFFYEQKKPYFAGIAAALSDSSRSSRLANWNFNVSHHGKYVAIASEPVCLVSQFCFLLPLAAPYAGECGRPRGLGGGRLNIRNSRGGSG